ncbi:MAG: methyltransferase [Pseudomonadota bacterium]
MSNRSRDGQHSTPDSLLDRLKSLRVRLIGNRKFQKFAADFWPTRGIARNSAAASFDLCAGFVYSQILQACVELNLLSLLQDDPLTIDDIAAVTNLPRDGAERLMKAACCLDLTETRSRGRYGLGQMGAAILSNPGVLQMVQHHRTFYEDLKDPVSLLQGRSKDTNLARFWPYAAGSETSDNSNVPASRAYSDLMGQTQGFIAEDVLDAYDVSRHQRLMDVAGGDGSFLRAAKARAPGLDIGLFDLPAVADLARERFQGAGITADVSGGDMFQDAWPDGADLISLVRILHDHDDGPVLKLLQQAKAALAPGGTLLIAEPMADEGRMGDAYFGLYLWAMGSGRPRRFQEIQTLLRKAGFSSVEGIKTRQPLLVKLIKAT